MKNELAGALALALDIAKQAGALIRADFHRSSGPRGQRDHADVDVEAERLIRSRLLAANPEWGYRGEETGSTGVDPLPRYLWLVDPNDATRAYLQGCRGNAVSIALLRDRRPVLGVVYAPCAPDDDGDLVVWAEGCGPPTRNGHPLGRQQWPDKLGPHECILVSQDADNGPAFNVRCVAPGRYRPMPSIAYRLALTAAGDAAVGTSFKGAGDWDYAGGQALLRAVGADLFDEEGRAVGYSPRGESRSRACFGGAPQLVPGLLHRPWRQMFGPPDHEPTPPMLRRASLAPGKNIAQPSLLRRAHGCLLGQLAGDALGSLVEGWSAIAIRERYPAGLRDLADGGLHLTIAGQPTDDSEMALALARSVVAGGGYDSEIAAQGYGYWFQSGPFGFGSTTAQALGAIPPLNQDWHGGARRRTGAARSPSPSSSPIKASNPPAPGAADAAMAAANRDGQANGSLMRVSPLGIWGYALAPDVLADAARADSRLTHPNVVCQESCAVLAAAIAHAVATGAPARQTYLFARSWAQRRGQSPAVLDALLAAEREPPVDYRHNPGWVLIALQNAFFQLLHAPTAEEAIVATVMAGGDTDTNAAIAGALLGAVHGRESLPRSWRNLILSCRPVAGGPGVMRPRPEPFWPVDALELAERLLLAGAR